MSFRVIIEFLGPLFNLQAVERPWMPISCLDSGPSAVSGGLFIDNPRNGDDLPTLIGVPCRAGKGFGLLAMSSDKEDLMGDFGKAFDPAAALRTLGTFVDQWCHRTPGTEAAKEKAPVASGLRDLPSYVATCLADFAEHRPLLAKLAFARLALLGPGSKLLEDTELRTALSERADRALSRIVLQEKTDAVISRFESFAPLYFKGSAGNLSESEKSLWKSALSAEPPACLDLLNHPDLGAAAFLFFTSLFRLSSHGYPERE
jgi:hypothetical protein